MSKKLWPIHPGADFAGMFLVLDNTDHQHYRTGQIVAVVGNCYLIQFDKSDEKIRCRRWSYTRSKNSAGYARIAGRSLLTCSRPALIWSSGSPGSNEPEKSSGQSGKVVHLKKPH